MSLISAKQETDVMAEINITPFTDVLLVLLIIFMILAALITPPGFQKELPNHNDNLSQAQNDPKKEIDVEVTSKGVIFVDTSRITEPQLYYVMSQTAARRGRLHVSITADAKAPYGLIIRILDAAKQAGLDDVGFVTS